MKAYFAPLVVRVIPPPDGALLPLTVEFVIVSPYFGDPKMPPADAAAVFPEIVEWSITVVSP